MEVKNVNYKDVQAMLPDSWEAMKLYHYKKILNVNIKESDKDGFNLFVGADNMLNVISALTDIPVEQFEELPAYQFAVLCNHLNYINELPKPDKKTSIRWKSVNEISYADFVIYQQSESNLLENVDLIIQAYSKNKYTSDVVNNLSMLDIYNGFFLLNKLTKKFIKRSILYSVKTLMKQWMMKAIKRVLPRRWQKMPNK